MNTNPRQHHLRRSILLLCLSALGATLADLHAQVPNLINFQGRVAVGTTNFDSATAGHPGYFKFALVDQGGATVQATATAQRQISLHTIISVTVTNSGYGYVTPPAVTFSSGPAAATAVLTNGRVTSIVITNAGSGYFTNPTVTIAPPPPGNAIITYWRNSPDASPADGEPDDYVPQTVIKGLYSVLLGDTSLGSFMAAIPASVFANSDVRLRVWFSDGTGFQLLAPDQRIAPSSYLSDGAVTSAKLAPNLTLTGTTTGLFTGNGAGLTAVTAASVSPNVITATNFMAGTAAAGMVLSYNGSALNWTTPTTGGGGTLTLPYSQNGTAGGPLFSISNSSGEGLMGSSSGSNGVHGTSNSASNSGVWGNNTVGGTGVAGSSISGKGVWGSSTTGVGIYGEGATWAGDFLGNVNVTGSLYAFTVEGSTTSFDGTSSGVHGIGARPGGLGAIAARGVVGESSNNDGVFGISDKNGVHGWSTSPTDSGVWGDNTGNGFGVSGSASGSGTGVIGTGASGAGVRGISTSNDGVFGSSAKNGVHGYSNSLLDSGVWGDNPNGNGVTGSSNYASKSGVWGNNTGATVGNSRAVGVSGSSAFGNGGSFSGGDAGIYATGTNYAAFFDGNVETNGNLKINGTATVNVLTILGADVAEPFAIAEPDLKKGTVVVIDDTRVGGLKQSTRAYDKCVAGIVSGANGVRSGIILSQPGVNEGGQNVAISGRVYVQADASSGAIKPGDMLTSSDKPGHAMKASDHDRAQGAIIGKAMSSLRDGTGVVLVLVSLQ